MNLLKNSNCRAIRYSIVHQKDVEGMYKTMEEGYYYQKYENLRSAMKIYKHNLFIMSQGWKEFKIDYQKYRNTNLDSINDSQRE